MRLSHGEEFPDLWNSHFNTSDLQIYPGSNEFRKYGHDNFYIFLTVNNQGKIANNYARQALELIAPANLASNGGVVVPDEMFKEWRNKGNEIGLIEVPRNDTINRPSDYGQWLMLSRDRIRGLVRKVFGDEEDLLGRYSREVRKRSDFGLSVMMPTMFDKPLKNKTTLKAWCIYPGYNYCSLASGAGGLDFTDGRFVGMAWKRRREKKV